MKIETVIIFKTIDGDNGLKELKIEDPVVGNALVIPSIGEKVRIWRDDKNKNFYHTHYVVDIVHYIWGSSVGVYTQEIVITCSVHR